MLQEQNVHQTNWLINISGWALNKKHSFRKQILFIFRARVCACVLSAPNSIYIAFNVVIFQLIARLKFILMTLPTLENWMLACAYMRRGADARNSQTI